MKFNEETRHTYLALLAADGRLTVYENETSENLSDYTQMDDFTVCQKPGRGEETSFRVRFDPNPDPCYTALRAGTPTDTLSLVVAAMDQVKIYRTRDVLTHSLGVGSATKQFYEAAVSPGHRGLVRDVAWAPGNIRGYDIIASACMDGFVRVLRVDTPTDPSDGKTWSSNELVKSDKSQRPEESLRYGSGGESSSSKQRHSKLSEQMVSDKSANGDRRAPIKHRVQEMSKLENNRTPMWRVSFDDDGQILGSVGDDGKLICYRQASDGSWFKSSEIGLQRMKMAVPNTT